MELFWIIFSLLSSGVVLVFVVYKFINRFKKKQCKYVYENSTVIKQILQLNKKYNFTNDSNRELGHHLDLNSKKAFDNFDVNKNLKIFFNQHKFQIKNAVVQYLIELSKYEIYKSEFIYIQASTNDEFPKSKYVSEKKFRQLEKVLIEKEKLKLSDEVKIVLSWSYTSPAGRNRYNDCRELNTEKIIQTYEYYFGDNLRNYEQIDKRDNAMTKVGKSLTKDVYKINDVIELFKKQGYEADENLAILTLTRHGFIERKGSPYYIRESVKNIKDFILASAEENGLITYDNAIKDNEYDNAIKKLQDEGRILPIDNLHFLKISKNLNYKGVTIFSINEFTDGLYKYAKTLKYISLQQIKENVSSAQKFTQFDEEFLYLIVKICGYVNEVRGVSKLFTIDENVERISYLEWLVGDNKSVNAYDVSYDLKEDFGIDYPVSSMIYDINKGNTNLYFNEETEKIYKDKEYFFEELEGVL